MVLMDMVSEFKTEVCLLEPDVIKVYAVFEANDTGVANLPSISLFNLNGPTGKTEDFVIGEEMLVKLVVLLVFLLKDQIPLQQALYI